MTMSCFGTPASTSSSPILRSVPLYSIHTLPSRMSMWMTLPWIRYLPLQPAWINLVFLYEKQARQADRIAILDRYLKWNPQNIWFRQLKAMLPKQP